jgi:hypothetical protein
MRSGTIREQDRVVWVGDTKARPAGSSGKAREVTRSRVEVDWGGGTTGEHRRGAEVVSCAEAARRGIEPWASAFGGGS